MIRFALKGLAGRKFRALLTALAIVLGVAMVSGTYVLTDTIDRAFKTIFTDSYAGTDAIVTGKGADITFQGMTTEVPPVEESVLERVRAIDGVEAAVGSVSDETAIKILGKDGELVNTQGAPSLGFGVDPSQQRFNPLNLESGEWANGPGEVVIDAGTAEAEGYVVGDKIRIASLKPIEEFTLTGIAKFGNVDSLGSATFAVFELETGQRLLEQEGTYDGISVAAESGLPPETLVERLEAGLPENVEVQTGVQAAEDDVEEITEFTKFIRYFLLAFGGIALFVGAFVIFNTLSITVAQRVREFATLRTIGASRRQLLASVVIEALVIGILASIIGLFAGFGLARGLNALFVALELDLPQTDAVFATRTVVVSLAIGIVVTLVAGIFPAIRATRVPPIAAVREGATLPRSRFAPYASYIALALIALSIALLAYGMFADDLDVLGRLGSIGVGCLLLFAGVALVSSRLIRPLVSALGPFAAIVMRGLEILFFPITLGYSLLARSVFAPGLGAAGRLWRWAASVGLFAVSGGVGVLLVIAGLKLPTWLGAVPVAIGAVAAALAAAGIVAGTVALPVLIVVRLIRGSDVADPPEFETERSTELIAKENARRNPGRTAATAAALMIGVALVTFVAVLAQGMRTSNGAAIESQVKADYVVTPQDGFTPFVAAAGDAVARGSSVELSSDVRSDLGEIDGEAQYVTGIDPATIAEVYSFEWKDGSDTALGELGDRGAILSDDFAESNDLAVGDEVTLRTPSDLTYELEVVGIYEPPPFYPILGGVSIAQDTFDELYERERNQFTFVNVDGDPSAEARAPLQTAVAGFPDAKILTRQEWIDDQEEDLNLFLNLLYVLLALSVVVSLFGMVNTLVLSVFERTRELGMLRAVGMTRRQIRRMIRHESVITALIGASLGLPLGIFLAALVTGALSQFGLRFEIPIGSLVTFAIVSVIAVSLTAVLPARRAARLNVLNALQYE